MSVKSRVLMVVADSRLSLFTLPPLRSAQFLSSKNASWLFLTQPITFYPNMVRQSKDPSIAMPVNQVASSSFCLKIVLTKVNMPLFFFKQNICLAVSKTDWIMEAFSLNRWNLLLPEIYNLFSLFAQTSFFKISFSKIRGRFIYSLWRKSQVVRLNTLFGSILEVLGHFSSVPWKCKTKCNRQKMR